MTEKRKLDETELEHICEKCNLIEGKDINEITGGFWCKTCPVVSRKGKGIYFRIPTHEKSLATFDPLKMSRWMTEKNKTTPDQVFINSHNKYFFNCAKCKHVFENVPNSMNQRNRWCPFCINKLCKNDCKSCFDKSLASIEFPKGLSWVEGQTMFDKSSGTEEVITPRDVFKCGLSKKYDFKCDQCGHILKKTPHSLKYEYGCTYCYSYKRCDNEIIENCDFCMKRTFANFSDTQKVAAWSDKNLPIRPCHVAMSHNGAKFIFKCFNPACLKEFKATTTSVTSKKRRWCPHCWSSSKSIVKVEEKLNSLEKVTYKKEISVKINGRNLRWDVEVNNNGNVFYIESDGEQHFHLKDMMFISRIRNDKARGIELLKDQRVKDLSKDNYIRNSGGLLFRISYRQFKQITQLVDNMIEVSNSGFKGVKYMDDIYWNSIEEESQTHEVV